MKPENTSGVIAAGNFIVDHVKIIDEYPVQDHLALVRSQTRNSGGGPFNLLTNLAALGVAYPLRAVGSLGDDADGEWIVHRCSQLGIDTEGFSQAALATTSWTDVMSVSATGRRTFFHYPGANAHLGLSDLQFQTSNARIFYLAYLNMLDAMDAFGADGRTAASHVFERASNAGMITIADLVSRNQPKFRDVVTASAPFLDYLLLNELEAGWILNRSLTGADLTAQNLGRAARDILSLGVRQAVVLHFEHGAVYAAKNGDQIAQPAVRLPETMIRSKLGAGDAFAAGFVHSLHDTRDAPECIRTAVCTAAACLTDPSSSGGIRPLDDCLTLGDTYAFHEFN
ncbi:MAG: carbohydrate kinase family protein [Pseudomonadota bacterium]